MQSLNAARPAPAPAYRVQNGVPHTVTGGREVWAAADAAVSVCWLTNIINYKNLWSAVLWPVGPWSQLATSGGDCIAHSARCTPRSVRYAHCVISTEIRLVVFLFSVGIGHYHSREFGNGKGLESWAPRNNNRSFKAFANIVAKI